MDKFTCIKCVENKQDIPIKNKIVSKLPWYFKDKYILKKMPYNIEDISFMDVPGLEVTLNFLEREMKGSKIERVIAYMLDDLYQREVCVAYTDTALQLHHTSIVFFEGKNLMSFFIWPVIKKALKYTNKELRNVEIFIIDNDDDNNTYNIIEAIYEEINFLTLFTNRAEYFRNYQEEIYSTTGLNLQIVDKNKALLKDADVIINLSDLLEERYDYFFKKGALYIDLAHNENKTLELLRKRTDINVLDNVIFSINNKRMDNSKIEAALYIKYRTFYDYICSYKYPKNKQAVYEIIKNEKLDITGFYHYRTIIRQYKS